jgi:phage baseplate assembly protein W
MIKEIYTRTPEDPNFKINVLDHSDPIESIISKVKMILGTRKGEVIGDFNFGIGIEDLIFETRINKLHLEEDIKSQINQYISEAKDYDIRARVEFGKTEGYDFCVIDIYIDNDKTFGILVK